MNRTLSIVVTLALFLSGNVLMAQTVSTAEYWQQYTAKLPIGSTIKIRTRDGRRLTAVLAVVDDSSITVEPKTRVPEAPRVIPLDRLQQLELKDGGGSGIGRAAVRALAERGSKIIVVDMDEVGGHRTVNMVADKGGTAAA